MLKDLEKRLGLPPLRQTVDIMAGPTGKRLDRVTERLVTLSQNGTLQQLNRLLELGQTPQAQATLARLESIMKGLPRGKQAEALLLQLIQALQDLGPRLDRLERLASILLKQED